jgi:hypothetical protein
MDAHLLRLHPRNLDHVRPLLDVGAGDHLIDLGVELIDNRLQRPAGAMRLSQMVDS